MRRLLSTRWFASACIALSMAIAQGATRNVTVSGLTFSPSVVTITNGDAVVWPGGSGFHTVSPRSGVTETFCEAGTFTACSLTFNNVGSFAYQCNIHALSSMTEQVIVAAAPSQPPTAATNGSSTQKFIRVRLQ
jgi:plastocyanin